MVGFAALHPPTPFKLSAIALSIKIRDDVNLLSSKRFTEIFDTGGNRHDRW